MAKILILSLVFPPDSVSTAQIMGQLAVDLRARGHEVQVLTTTPHYNRDARAEALQPRSPVWGTLLQRSCFKGIEVLHVWMPRKGARRVGRLMAWMGFHVLSLLVARSLMDPADLILAPSPPLTIGVCAWLLGRRNGAPFIYNVQEIYPDIAVAMGSLRQRHLVSAALALERFVYDKAAAVTVIAPRMRERLREKGVLEEKLVFIPNFVDLCDLQPLDKDNAFSREQGLQDRFVVSYAGNLGLAQGLEVFINAAAALREESTIQFLILGEGTRRDSLERLAARLQLTNLRFLPYQPFERMSEIYSASDLNLVSLAPQAGSDAVPSKIYRIMACARPVLAAVDDRSDLARLVQDSGCGWVTPPGSTDGLVETIRAAYRDPEVCRQRGLAGQDHVIVHYARPVVTTRYAELVETLAGRAKRAS